MIVPLPPHLRKMGCLFSLINSLTSEKDGQRFPEGLEMKVEWGDWPPIAMGTGNHVGESRVRDCWVNRGFFYLTLGHVMRIK